MCERKNVPGAWDDEFPGIDRQIYVISGTAETNTDSADPQYFEEGLLTGFLEDYFDWEDHLDEQVEAFLQMFSNYKKHFIGKAVDELSCERLIKRVDELFISSYVINECSLRLGRDDNPFETPDELLVLKDIIIRAQEKFGL